MKQLLGSVRFRVTAAATLLTACVLLVAGVALVANQRRTLTDQLKETLERRGDELAVTLSGGQTPTTLPSPTDDDSIAQLVSPGGRVLASSINVVGEPALTQAPPGFLMVSRPVDASMIIRLAAPKDDIHESVSVLGRSLALALPLVTLILCGLVWWLVRRTLRPVEAIRAEVADIGGSDLHRRVPVPPSGDEIARLAQTMNEMLERVEDSSARQQRFVADAAHELRTPLTRMRSELEVDLAHPERADGLATHRSVLEETTGLQHLVDDLLHLARSDSAAATTSAHDVESVDVDDIVLRLARRLREDGRVTVDTAGVTGAQVQGDVDQLARAIGNITANAGRHAASKVTITLDESDGYAVLAVSDDGPGVPKDAQERVFDRFARLDAARATSTGGAGLGLAIARDIVDRHGGTVVIDAGYEAGARFVVRLPVNGVRPADSTRARPGGRR